MWPARAALCSALLLCAAGHALVPAPENITVRCGDQRPVVSWDYSSQQPTNFTVSLEKHGPTLSTEDHEVDLSGFVWSSLEQVFGFHWVTVTAEQGPGRSEPRKSPTFSYSKLKTVDVTCFLKFPPVTLTGEGAEATLLFENPLHFYPELRSIKDSAEFLLSIVVEKKSEQDRPCGREPECKESVALPEGAEPCVNLTGIIRHKYEDIQVQHIGPVCAAASTDVFWAVAISVLVLIVVVILLVAFAVCKTRAWVISPPQTLLRWKDSPTSSKAVNSPSRSPAALQSQTVYSPVQVTGTRPRTIEDPESPTPQPHQVQGDEDQVLIQPLDLYEDQYESAESTQTLQESLSLHSSSSETEESNYERRTQVIVMDVSGDVVKGYTG